MAERARLIPGTVKAPDIWPWHSLKKREVMASEIFGGDRRMEAGNYLSPGYAIRKAIERRRFWVPFSDMARLWAPPRIKQVFVSPEYGTPYLNTSQVFETRPAPRKFLASDKTSKSDLRTAVRGTILVMASASPGRSTLVTAAHEGAFLSHHFMRVDPISTEQRGWIYAFLKSPQGRAMMSGEQYASVIRHIEPHHVAALPVPTVSHEVATDFNLRIDRILELRDSAFNLSERADGLFAEAVGPVSPPQRIEAFHVNASSLSTGRRRLEASYHTPVAAGILSRFKNVERLGDVAERVWWMPRLKRFYGDGGIPYISADELFSTNPEGGKRILVDAGDGHEEYFVQPDWIVMACSGQIYGMNGAATLLTKHLANTFFSHDLIRIVADRKKIRPGYLVAALTHRTHGRPLLIREAYGTSIPHLDPIDVQEFPVVRLSEKTEDAIADCVEEAAHARFEADVLEREIAVNAGKIIEQFVSGK